MNAPVFFAISASHRTLAVWARVATNSIVLAVAVAVVAQSSSHAADEATVVDLSLLVAPEYPGPWPAAGFPPFHIDHYLAIGPTSPYNGDILAIDGNTGTQLDVPPHSIPHPDTNLPNAGPYGRVWTDKVPAWQFGGEACVIDCRDIVDSGVNGRSALVTRDRIMAWERDHRPLSAGDVVLFRSDYWDKFFRPLPEGRRYLADPVEGLHARLARSRSRLHGIPGQPQSDGPGDR